MAILTEHEAGIWGATLATVQEQRERIAQLEAALITERATGMYLRDEVERFKDEGQVWPTAIDIAPNLPYARLELQREKVLP